MSMTVKQLADSLGVSKPTISKAISELGLQEHLHKVGNRFVLEEAEIQAIKSQVLQAPKSQEPQETKTPIENQSKKSETISEKSIISLLEAQVTILSQQLSVKDSQIAAQQEQIKQLTESLHDTTAALTAAQALHAGTIKQQLTEKQTSLDEQSEDVPEPEPQEQKKFWQRIFKKQS